CFRIRKAKWSIFCVPAAKVVHLENLRSGHRRLPRNRMVIDFHVGAYRFYRTNCVSWWSPMGLISAVGLFTRAALIVTVNEFRRRFGQLGTKANVTHS